MPTGNPTVQQTPISLDSFLSRRRLSPAVWLERQSIKTMGEFTTMLRESTWDISDSLKAEFQRLLLSTPEKFDATPVLGSAATIAAVEPMNPPKQPQQSESDVVVTPQQTKKRHLPTLPPPQPIAPTSEEVNN